MNTTSIPENKVALYRKIIIALSIVIPVAVAALFKIKIEGLSYFKVLPPIYATINGLTAILLVSALLAIKKRNIDLHKRLIQACLMLSLLFLLCYVAYHMASNPTIYGDINHDGKRDKIEALTVGKSVFTYYFLLTTHVILSVLVIPVVLFTYLFALEGKFEKHKRWTRFAFPVWLYVAITGVIVYLMISPYYV
jgi:putative membrane protein